MKGKADEFLPKIKQRLLLRYSIVDAVSSPEIDGAENLAFKNASKYDIVVSYGGDGTLHQVINGVMKSGASPLVGILPYGTCNDVAKTLGIPTDLDLALDCILRLNTTEYDLMYDGKEYITYSMSTGYLTPAVYSTTNKMKKRFGKFAYFLKALKYMFKCDELPITVTVDGERIHDKFMFLLLINGENAGGFKLNQGAILNDGKIKLVLIKKGKGLSGFFTFMKLFMGGINRIRKSKKVIVKDIKKIEIENHSNSPFTLDGEKTKFLKRTIQVSSKITLIKK